MRADKHKSKFKKVTNELLKEKKSVNKGAKSAKKNTRVKASFPSKDTRELAENKEAALNLKKEYTAKQGPLSSTEERRIKREQKKKRKKRLGCIIPLVLVLCLIITGGVVAKKGYNYVYGKLEKMNHKEVNKDDLEISKRSSNDLKDFRNIAILGIDTREGEDDETCRTDAIIMATVDKKSKKIKLTSIDRDTYWTVDEVGVKRLDKTNHAHAYGGPAGTMRALNRNADLNVDGFVRVNWKTVADTVDAMGGLVLPIKDYEINEMNKYIRDTNKNLHGDDTPITKAGKQKLNGIQAVTYCRIRKVGNGDTERAERMRRTLEACISKVKTMSFKEIDAMADKILPEITTNLTSKEIIRLMITAARCKIENSGGFPYVSDGKVINGVWYTPPITLEKNVIELHKRLFGQKDYVPSEEVQLINNEIIQATGFDGTGYPEPGEEN
ncbi:MAG: LCP family protein [Anaerovoracaceae bacterium]